MKNIIISFFLFQASFSFSQEQIKGLDYRACSTAERYNEIINNNPILKGIIDQQNKFAQEWTLKNYGKPIATNQNGKKSILYIIPVVWHVIHNDGPENLSKAAIEEEIAKLNEDYQKLNADITNAFPLFAGISADCQIEFRLARLDPNGNCTEGITRTKSTLTYAMDDNVKMTIRPSWNTPTVKYLNIWQGTKISFDAGGYSYYPGTTSDETEGLVLIAQQLGNTVTHETGHFLNLAHPWGDSNSPQDPNNCFDDDQVTDTPNTIGQTGCSDTSNSCGSIDNVQNYMDYNFCDVMFTEGQKQRMHAALNSPVGYRDLLCSQSNLINTGTADPYNQNPICTPIADFNYNKTYLCEGEQVIFTDNSYNATPTSYNWTFVGGAPSTDTVQNPIITYNTEGIYSVTHQPSTTGGTGYISKSNIIIVSGINADYSLPYSDSFENLTSFNNDWLISGNATHNWQNVSTIGFTGTRSAMVNNQTNLSTQITELSTPSFDLTTNPNYELTFKYAYAQQLLVGNDRLIVYYSSNCGRSWSILNVKVGATLATAPSTDSFFIPNSSQWAEERINLSTLSSLNNVKFKFYVRSNGGNNIWIDDINIDIASSVNEPAILLNFSVYPNPTNESAALSFSISKNVNSLTVLLRDISGKEIANVVTNQSFDAGKYTMSIDQGRKLASGMYLIEFNLDGKLTSHKLVVN